MDADGTATQWRPILFNGGRFNACVFWLLALVMAVGCATPPPPPASAPRPRPSIPADGLVTQRAVLTARGRQFALNGYLALSAAGGKRLIVTQSFGQVLADVLIKPNGSVRVVRSSPMLRPEWIRRYVAADLECLFGDAPGTPCPVRALSTNHFLIERRWYKLDLQIVETKPGPQTPELFDETRPTP
jgi:hypothetical protein